VTSWTGEVAVEVVAAGTKSERSAVVLHTDAGRLRLRRVGQPSYGPDAELEAHVGSRVTVTGELLRDVVLVESVTPA
jgi:hypothetical protein